jgi:hypothetical protein
VDEGYQFPEEAFAQIHEQGGKASTGAKSKNACGTNLRDRYGLHAPHVPLPYACRELYELRVVYRACFFLHSRLSMLMLLMIVVRIIHLFLTELEGDPTQEILLPS